MIYKRHNQAFTLVELLIVIGILAVLSTTTVVVLNPAQLLAQGRDAKRAADISTINRAIFIYDSQGGTMGSGNTVYISLPDVNAPACTSWTALPALPATWSYQCASPTNHRKIDGNGWIPLNFSSIPGLSMTVLPIDPINSASGNQYYTYIGGSWSLTSVMESNKYLRNNSVSDGGLDPGRLESGSNKSLWTQASGLVGYWPLDEGAGTVAYDVSGNTINGTMTNSLTWKSGSECINVGCINAIGGVSGAYISIPYNSKLNLTTNLTYINWIKIKGAIPASNWPVSLGNTQTHTYYGWRSSANGTSWMFEYGQNSPTCDGTSWTSMGGVNLGTNTWHQLAATYDGTTIKTYLDGAQIATRSFSLGFCNNSSVSFFLAYSYANGAPADYLVDDARIYSRALSASEISANYNAIR